MKLNTIIPMVEFIDETKNIFPRYLRQIDDKILLEKVIDSLRSQKHEQNFIFLVSEQFETKFHVSNTIQRVAENAQIHFVKCPTAGAVCTLLLGIDYVDENPCIVVSHDQILKTPLDDFIGYNKVNDCSASLMVFDGIHPKWSFVEIDERSRVIRAVGNQPVSRNASTGIYFFKNSLEFMGHCKNYLNKFGGSEGPYYTNLVLNEYILNNQLVMAYKIDNEAIDFFKRDEG